MKIMCLKILRSFTLSMSPYRPIPCENYNSSKTRPAFVKIGGYMQFHLLYKLAENKWDLRGVSPPLIIRESKLFVGSKYISKRIVIWIAQMNMCDSRACSKSIWHQIKTILIEWLLSRKTYFHEIARMEKKVTFLKEEKRVKKRSVLC